MARWMAIVAFWLTGIWKEIEKEVLADSYVECDEPKRSEDSQPYFLKKPLANRNKIP